MQGRGPGYLVRNFRKDIRGRSIKGQTSYHAYGIADLECRFEHKIWHKIMSTLKTSERFRSVVRCNIVMKYRRRHTEINVSPLMGKKCYYANDIRAHSTTAWNFGGKVLISGFALTTPKICVRPSTFKTMNQVKSSTKSCFK